MDFEDNERRDRDDWREREQRDDDFDRDQERTAEKSNSGGSGEGVTIYVSSMNFETNEDDLRDLFSKFGEIKSVSIVRDPATKTSRGFGFVVFSGSDDASAAIDALNGSSVAGRNIRVERAKRAAPHEKTPGRYLGPPQSQTFKPRGGRDDRDFRGRDDRDFRGRDYRDDRDYRGGDRGGRDFRGDGRDFRGDGRDFRGDGRDFRGDGRDFRGDGRDYRDNSRGFERERAPMDRGFRGDGRDYRDFDRLPQENREYRENNKEYKGGPLIYPSAQRGAGDFRGFEHDRRGPPPRDDYAGGRGGGGNYGR